MRLDRRALLMGLLAAGCTAPPARPESLTVAAAGQPAAILIQAVRPEALAGWPRRPSEDSLAWLRPQLADLSELGAITSSDAPASLEAMAALSPDLVLDYGDAGPAMRDLAAQVGSRLGVRYELIDGALDRLPDALHRAGALLERPETASRLAAFAGEVLSEWRDGPRGSGSRFFYARGSDGLETAGAGSLATEVLEGAGWTNVVPPGAGKGLITVSREQLIAWAPDVIVTLDPDFARAARTDPVWSDGERDRILLLPRRPFGWLDQPPSINRLLGCAWLAQHHDQPRLAQTVREFHRLFYGREIGPEEVSRLLAPAA